MSLATKLVTLRKEKGLTQMELAERLNVSRQAISRWEVGAAVPSIDNLRTLGELYDVPVDYLLDDTVDSFCRDLEHQEQCSIKIATDDDNKKQRILRLILIVILLIVTLAVSYQILPREHEKEPIPISQMDGDIDTDNDYITYTFTME